MPTSSQALIVLTTDEQCLRIPMRYFSRSVTDLPLETESTDFHPPFHKERKNRTYINCDDQDQSTADEKRIVQKSFGITKGHLNEAQKWNKTDGLEIIGFRKRNINSLRKLTSDLKTTTVSKDSSLHIKPSIPKDAKFMPSPPGKQPNPLKVTIKLPSANQCECGERLITYCSYGCMSLAEEPISLLDELKELVSYDSRLLPSMQMRKSLPPSSPNTVVFTLKNNDDYTHKEIMELIKEKTGTSVQSVQYDPVNVQIGGSEIPSRWVVQLPNAEETRKILQNGLEINGEKIIIMLLDDVCKLENIAFQLKMEEERKNKERNTCTLLPRKNRNIHTRTKQKQNEKQQFSDK